MIDMLGATKVVEFTMPVYVLDAQSVGAFRSHP